MKATNRKKAKKWLSRANLTVALAAFVAFALSAQTGLELPFIDYDAIGTPLNKGELAATMFSPIMVFAAFMLFLMVPFSKEKQRSGLVGWGLFLLLIGTITWFNMSDLGYYG